MNFDQNVDQISTLRKESGGIGRGFEKLIRIKIQVLPTDTVAQWVEHRRDKPWTWVQILASVILFLVRLCSFFLCYPCEALEGPTLTRLA